MKKLTRKELLNALDRKACELYCGAKNNDMEFNGVYFVFNPLENNLEVKYCEASDYEEYDEKTTIYINYGMDKDIEYLAKCIKKYQ